MASMKNKKRALKFLLIGTFFVSVFFCIGTYSNAVFAQDSQSAAAIAAIQAGDNTPEDDGAFTVAIKYLLYSVLWLLTGLVQVAASVFAWATKPEYISGPTGLLNLSAVYELWKFIRDFFNLTFIFLLLFSAFATVFQIEKFSIKKNFLKIILAAIAINFSFPLTRIIIDLGNVPMYFFAKGLVQASGAGGNALSSIPSLFFQSSGMSSMLLLPNPAKTGTLMPLLSAVIFTFIFMITLFTLAILFVIRLLKLVVLLIFSPIGVAASIIPGLEKYGKDWWSQLLQTVFFGPAAMLMVVIALRFTLELNGGAANTGTTFSQGLGGSTQTSSAASQSSIISQGLFFIPIIFMWMAMHMGSKFSINGANEVIKRADKAVAWGKKQATFGKGSWTRKGVAAAPGAARVRGIGAGIKDKFNDKVGTPLKNKREEEEARGKAMAKGLLTREKGSYAKAIEKADADLRDKRAREQEKKWKDDGKTTSEILKELNDDDNYKKDKDGKLIPKATALAAANYLANEKDALKKAKDLEKVMATATAAGKKDLYDKALQSATKDALELNPEQMQKIIDNEVRRRGNEYKPDPKLSERENAKARSELRADARKTVEKSFSARTKKEGKFSHYLDYKVEKNRNVAGVSATDATAMKAIREDTYKNEKVLNMSAKDMAKQESLLKSGDFKVFAKEQGKFTDKYLNSVTKFALEDGNVELESHINEIRSGGSISTVDEDEVSLTEASPREQQQSRKEAMDARAAAARANKARPKN